jgi:hypothetical protein
MPSIRDALYAIRWRWWVIVALGLGAAAVVWTQASRQGDGSSQHYALDTTSYEDFATLVAASDLIVVGHSDGQSTIRAVLADGVLADFEQSIAVREVVAGTADDTVTVIRLGSNPDSDSEAVPMDAGETAAGPIPQGDYLLFLQPSAAKGSWSVVGHDQGAMSISSDGSVSSVFPDVDGVAMEEVVEMTLHLAGEGPSDSPSH